MSVWELNRAPIDAYHRNYPHASTSRFLPSAQPSVSLERTQHTLLPSPFSRECKLTYTSNITCTYDHDMHVSYIYIYIYISEFNLIRSLPAQVLRHILGPISTSHSRTRFKEILDATLYYTIYYFN